MTWLAALVATPAALVAAPGDLKSVEPPPRIIISENPSNLHIAPPWGLTLLSQWSPRTACTSFVVAARKGTLSNTIITSAGLGPAQFSVADLKSSSGPATALLLPIVSVAGVRLTLCIDANLVAYPGDSLDGKILVLINDERPIETSIRVDKPVTDPPSAAFLWFVALCIPALLTAIVALITSRVAERRKQLARFSRYQDIAHSQLKDFFTTHYGTLYTQHEKDALFADALEVALREQRIWLRIPDRERRRLVKDLRCARRERIRRLLTKLFDDWRKDIDNPVKGPA